MGYEISEDELNSVEQLFRTFVEAVHSGRSPYSWQCRLMRFIVVNGRWPERVAAPTGAGKTSVIDIHVFLNALAGLTSGGNEVPEEIFAGIPYEVLSKLHLGQLPRRLVMTVNRRSLVDDQYLEAASLQERLQQKPDVLDSETEVQCKKFLRQMWQGLALRSGESKETAGENPYLRIVRLRGGAPADSITNAWRYHPTQCQIICATPDMFGSRLLFRGYGISAAARPIEAGLLAYDTVLVADEAHLSRQLVQTARRVAQLEPQASEEGQHTLVGDIVSPLQVVETTATPDSWSTGNTVGVKSEDFNNDNDADRHLKRVLASPKYVELRYEEAEAKDSEYAEHIARACFNAATDSKNTGVVGCVVNTVKLAEAVNSALCKLVNAAADDKHVSEGSVRCLIGPMRQFDKRETLDVLLRAVKGEEPDSSLRFVIGTQTLEVGIDADFSTLVTELAPASALVQRAGRVNRSGRNSESHVVVFVPGDLRKATGPYDETDLRKTLVWFDGRKLEDGSLDLSAWACAQSGVPAESPNRLAFQRLELSDVENLANTDESLAADVTIPDIRKNMPDLKQNVSDVNLWLRDDLHDDTAPDIGLVIRNLPVGKEQAMQLLALTPPLGEEAFPFASWQQIDDIAKLLDSKGRYPDAQLYVYRSAVNDGNHVLPWDRSLSLMQFVQSGDTIIISAADNLPLFDEAMPILKTKSGKSRPSESAGTDIYNFCQQLEHVFVLSLDNEQRDLAQAVVRKLNELADISSQKIDAEDKDRSEQTSSSSLVDVIQQLDSNEAELITNSINAAAYPIGRNVREKLKVNADFLHMPVSISAIYGEQLRFDKKGKFRSLPTIWLIARRVDDAGDGEIMQEFQPSSATLIHLETSDGHQAKVAKRAEANLRHLNFGDELCQAIRLAGRHHDEGKKDNRFQEILHYGLRRPTDDSGNIVYRSSDYLAKSSSRSPYFVGWERSKRYSLGLRGWRHEQRSAAEYWSTCAKNQQQQDDWLITRLIGTSHGHGRSMFRDSADTLIPDSLPDWQNPELDMRAVKRSARVLFDDGLWQTIVQRTNNKYGFWGVSYLEAVLRAADVTISKEG